MASKFDEWLVKTMADRLVIRISMDPRPLISDYSALLVGTGSSRFVSDRIGGYVRIEVRNNRIAMADVNCGIGEGYWKLPPPGDEGLFVGWCGERTEQIFKWKSVRRLQTFRGYLPLSHLYVIEHLASLKANLIAWQEWGSLTLGSTGLVENMIVQLEIVARQAHREASNGVC